MYLKVNKSVQFLSHFAVMSTKLYLLNDTLFQQHTGGI